MARTLSTAIQSRIDAGATDRVVLVQLYYGASDFIPAATHAVTVGGVQYLPILENAVGPATEWQLLNGGGVSIAPITITLSNTAWPDGSDVVDLIYTNRITGYDVRAFWGFSDMTDIDDWEPMLAGEIDSYSIRGDKISIVTRTFDLPDTEIAGRLVDAQNNELGGADFSGTGTILSGVHGRRIPVLFGDNLLSVLTPLYVGAANGYKYCVAQDIAYLDGVKTGTATDTLMSWEHNNTAKSATQLYVADGDYAVPMPSTMPSGVTWEYATAFDSTNKFPALGLRGYESGTPTNSFNNDFQSVSFLVPLKLWVADSAWIDDGSEVNTGSSTSLANASNITDLDRTTSFTLVQDTASDVGAGLHLECDIPLDWNLRIDPRLSARQSWRVHTFSNAGYPGMIFGRLTHNMTSGIYTPRFVLGFGQGGVYPLYGGTALLVDEKLVGFSARPLYGFNSNMFCVGDGATTGFDQTDLTEDQLDYGEVQTIPGLNWTGLLSLLLKSWQSNSTLLTRELLDNDHTATIELGCGGSLADGKTYTFYEIYVGSFGTLEFKDDEKALMAACSGFQIADGEDILSIGSGTNVRLKRPYEYMEMILRHTGAVDADFSDEWAGAATPWATLFSTGRDYSGFTLTDSTRLRDFGQEYFAHQPYVVYRDADGIYRLVVLQGTYDADDINGTLVYADADGGFDVELSPMSRVCAEIGALKTGYIDALDVYEIEQQWSLDGGEYDYTYEDHANSLTSNRFKVDEIALKYTTHVRPQNVSYDGSYYTCIRTILNSTTSPDSDTAHFRLLPSNPGNSSAWTTGNDWYGEDSEQFVFARWYLNMWANRRPIITFRTSKLDYSRFEVGDIVDVSGCPNKLNGMTIRGFNGSSTWNVAVNGQDFYGAFMVIGVQPGEQIEITAIQLVDLTAYTPVNGSPTGFKVPKRKPKPGLASYQRERHVPRPQKIDSLSGAAVKHVVVEIGD